HRYQDLAQQGVVSREQRDAAENRYKMAQAAYAEAEHSVTVAESNYEAAHAAEKRTVRGFRPEDIAAAKADMDATEGQFKLAQARFAEREVRAPADSVVEVMDLRPGDLVAANAPVTKLLEVDQLYVVVYVPQDQLSKVRVGQSADVTVDAYGKEK